MTIATGIPSNWRLPLFWLSMDASRAGSFRNNLPALLIGTAIAAGTATRDVPLAVGNLEQIRQAAGVGSELYLMGKTFLQNNAAQELYILPIAEPAAGTAASGTITITGSATAPGTLPLYVGDRRVDVAVNAGDSATVIGTNSAAAINAVSELPVTAAAAGGVVTLTAKWKGLTGNQIRFGSRLGGAFAGEVIPAGVSVAVAQPANGTGTPSLVNAIANLGDEPYEYVALAYNDATSLDAIEAEFGFADAGRWGWMRMLYGHVFAARADTYSGHLTFLATRNMGVTSIMTLESSMPTPAFQVAAAYTAQAAKSLQDDPARPLQTLPMLGVMAAPKEDRFGMLERNAIANNGGAVQQTMNDGTVQIRREQTTYQFNSYGQPDDAYDVVPTLATLARISRELNSVITNRYPRHKLANNGTRVGPGQAIVTPNVIKAEIVAHYDLLEYNGLVEDVANFTRHLIVERDPNNKDRLNVLYPPDLVNQFRIAAFVAQFRLQYERLGSEATVA